MPKTREQKKEIFAQAKSNTRGAKALVFVGYHGLSVPKLQELRRELCEQDVAFQVIKKTIIKKVLDEAGINVDVKNLGQGLAVAYAMSDEVSAPKILAKFAKENESLHIYGGVLEQKFVDKNLVIELSKLLSKPELYAKLVGSINSPISGFVNTMAGVMRGFVRVLDGVRNAKS